jgi:hypothetical protein
LSVLYTVRSKFTDPAREDGWNEWYAGHLRVLLSVPGFLAAQRFHCSTTVDDRPYLAMYEVAGAEVFDSEPYRAIWGFHEWRPLIDNWARDLSDPDGAIAFATPRRGHLWAGFVSGPDGAVGAALAQAREARPGIGSAIVSGLDRSCSAIAWAVLGEDGQPAPDLAAGADSALAVAQALYTPISECLGPADTNGGAAR